MAGGLNSLTAEERARHSDGVLLLQIDGPEQPEQPARVRETVLSVPGGYVR